jgi:hypothetical protein
MVGRQQFGQLDRGRALTWPADDDNLALISHGASITRPVPDTERFP